MSTTRNLVNLSGVGKDYAARTILEDITLGIADRDRIGVVGGNGQGKSTLLELIAGAEDAGRGAGHARRRAADRRCSTRADRLPAGETIREVLVGDRAEHEWAGNREFRGVLDGLLGGVTLRALPAGHRHRRRTASPAVSAAASRWRACCSTTRDLLLLDEPTNHLDVEAIAWLAGHLAARDGAMLVVTHDRWFLDAVCTRTWEVADRSSPPVRGRLRGLRARPRRARPPARRRARTAAASCVRKELAWLRRGPPARTSKPKFRIEAANALIADEPPARDTTELLRFAELATRQQGDRGRGHLLRLRRARTVIDRVTWRLGPGDRVALVGANGSGKSTLLRLLAGELEPTARRRSQRGADRQARAPRRRRRPRSPEHRTVLEAVEEIRRRATLAGGEELTAGKLAERFGFRGEKARTLVRDLSGGERRRLTLMRLLMSEPNVLLLDEPTNDLDIETLTALEDLLDHWPGTLVVVSHDRYFVERVADNVFALDAIGGIRHLPGGIDQYLAELAAAGARRPSRATPAAGAERPPKAGTQIRQARKDVQRLERELERTAPRARAARADGRQRDRPHPARRSDGSAGRARRRARAPRVRLAGGRRAGRPALGSAATLRVRAIATAPPLSPSAPFDPRPATASAGRRLRSHWLLTLWCSPARSCAC